MIKPRSRLLTAALSGTILTWLAVAPLAGAVPGDLRLVDAARRQDQEAVRALLKQQVDVNSTQADGASALAWAAHWDDLETAELLMRAGAKVNVSNELGVTPLMLSSVNGSAALVAALLRAGADRSEERRVGKECRL